VATNPEEELVTVALIGERNLDNVNHLPTEEAFEHLSVETEWVDTSQIELDGGVLDRYDGIMLPPAMPYASEEGALNAISYARTKNIPMLGTCGGFQYTVIELARSLLGIARAQHAETHPEGENLVVTPLACSLVGQAHPVRVERDSLAGDLYGVDESVEPFFCSYGVSPTHRKALEQSGVRFTGFDRDGEPRILELPSKEFFLATLYVPQARKDPEPHPVIAGLVEATRRVAQRDHAVR
jgi:CTP synthase (UTP-ammonia lyase)